MRFTRDADISQRRHHVGSVSPAQILSTMTIRDFNLDWRERL